MKIKLGQALEYEQPTKYIVASEKYKDEYETPVLTAGKSFILGYTNETDGIYTNLPVIIFDDFTTDVKFVDFPFKVKSSAMKMLQPSSEEYNLKFFYYLIKFMNFQPTSHQRHWISKFAEFEFDIPAREKQDEIVEKLDKLCEMLALKDKELKKYDDLVKSQFIEMFKDVKTKEKLNNVCDIIGGFAFKSSDITRQGIKLLQISNVYHRNIDWTIKNSLPTDFYDKYSQFSLKENDIVIALTRPIIQSIKTVKMGIIRSNDIPCLLNQRVCKITNYKDTIDKNYLYSCLETENFTEFVQANCKGSSQPNISTKDISRYEILLPPIELQNQFANFVKHIDKLKFTIKESIEKLNLCYQSLMKEYFE